jgi:signal transduction histidine kinase
MTGSQQHAGEGIMGGRLTVWLGRGSLLLRFSLLSLVVLTLIAVGLATMLQRELEHDALVQQADEVATIMDGVVGHHLRPNTIAHALQPAGRAWWGSLTERLMAADQHLVRVTLLDTHGRVVYSNNPRLIGRVFPLDDNLSTALSGVRAMGILDQSPTEDAGDRSPHTRLLETYIPVQARGRVIGALEGDSDLSALTPRLDAARRTVLLSVTAGFILLYSSLFAIVHRASRRLIRQMQEINQLAAQAREAEALRAVDRLKDEFIGHVSHELRRPLASIKGYTASLLLRDAAWEPEVQREFLQVIDDEADHLALQIDNLLDLARLGAGSLHLNPETLHLPVLTEQVVRRVRAQAHLPPHPYEVRFPERFPYVAADHARLTQVLLNLLENAAKYAPADTPIVVAGHAAGDRVAISVHDQGPGLTADQAARVFDKFYRVDSGLTRTTGGSGLGLAICRGIVEAHGGQITVTATPGRGCIFTVSLPAIADQPVTPAGAPLLPSGTVR